MKRSLLVGFSLIATLVAGPGRAEPGSPVPAGAAPPSLEPALAGTSRFVGIDPARAGDTRLGIGTALGSVAAGSEREVDLSRVVPAGASAVALNVTLADSAGPGYGSLFAAGAARPATSNLNVDGWGQTVANAAIVPLAGSARVRIFSSTTAHYIVDVKGYFLPAEASSAGRFAAVVPARALDTRGGATLAAGSSVRIALAGRFGLPPTGVSAVALSVTAVGTSGPGWLQVYPTGGDTDPGESSNVNVVRAGQTVANLALVALGRDGSVTLHSAVATHALVDVVGWFSDTTAPASEDGLFLPVSPTRLLDTRSGGRAAAGSSVPVSVASLRPAGVRVIAVAANVTAVGSAGPGYITAHGSGAPPNASNLNIERSGHEVTVAALAAVSGSATNIFTSVASHLIADAFGMFVRPGAVVGGRDCIVSLHGKGGGGQPSWTDSRGVRRIYPAGNAPGWGGRQWLYWPEENYRSARTVIDDALSVEGCGRAIIYGFSNGAAFSAKLYCRGETFGISIVGHVVDDPVVDEAVLGCAPNRDTRVVLYWTFSIDQPDGWRCSEGDWTCENDRAIGIARYQAALGVAVTRSPHGDHRPYDSPPEFTAWW